MMYSIFRIVGLYLNDFVMFCTVQDSAHMAYDFQLDVMIVVAVLAALVWLSVFGLSQLIEVRAL
jgi:hypothetical protein